jgi:hypothetical protein
MLHALAFTNLLAVVHTFGAITWDPFIRGVLIIAVAIIVLPGSVYLLLSTNTGVRVGFMLAMAGLWGWIFIMAVVWAVFGIGDVGRAAGWKTAEVITGDVNQSAVLTGFPSDKKWKPVDVADPEYADVSSAADKVLASSAASAPTPGKAESGGVSEAPRFPPPFSTPDQYVQVAHYRSDPTTVYHLRKHKFTPLGHDKHIDVVQAQPVITQPDTGGAPAAPTADKSKPITTVVLVRDLGSLRQPPIFIAIAAFLLFAVFCGLLHRRDKLIHAAQTGGGDGAAGGAGGASESQLVGAGRG